jgi:MiaB/RimO family radical SAM methylthiotransferase
MRCLVVWVVAIEVLVGISASAFVSKGATVTRYATREQGSLFSTASKVENTGTISTAATTQTWFPTRIQEDVDYTALVQSLYLRHIVVETLETAQLVQDQYLADTTSRDPFGELASKVSACVESREEAGKVGWIDVEEEEDGFDKNDAVAWSSPLLPQDVFQQLVDLAPKTGDVHILQSKSTDQVHLVRVEELMIKHNPNLVPSADKFTRVGSHTGRNSIISRSKLKGQGVMPRLPDLSGTRSSSGHDKTSYFIQTNGCQMNVADSERLAGILKHELKLTPAVKAEQADVVVFNTCSIRDHAEQKLYDLLGPFCARKRKGEEIALIVTGCVAQQEGEALLRKVPELDVVLGPQYVPFLSNVLEQIEWGNQLVATAPMLHKEDNAFAKPIRGHTVRGFVNTILGCNEHCTYCVVPATRGMEQSRPMESILEECLDMAGKGYREVTLLGQNIDAYGRDMTPRRSFSQLLEYLNANIPEKMRIRYTTSHPRYMSNKAIDAIADLDKVCECFHVPFQAGDNEVLKRMRRGYTFESYMKIIDRIKAKSPDAGIFADVIVGKLSLDDSLHSTVVIDRISYST